LFIFKGGIKPEKGLDKVYTAFLNGASFDHKASEAARLHALLFFCDSCDLDN
jgi:hypothetical protein